MAYCKQELVKLSREQVLDRDSETRLAWFKHRQVKHRELRGLTADLLHLVNPANETRIVTLIGMTGIGKTTLATSILSSVLIKYWSKDLVASDIPYVVIEAPANGEHSFSWKTLYQRTLTSAKDVLVNAKRQILVDEEFVKFDAGGKWVSLAALRESLESMLKHRNVRLLVIDEAFHLLRFESYSAVMDTLKSLANVNNTKLMLIGSYDLFELATEYGQVARRSEILHYKRYRIESEADRQEFAAVVEKLQSQWPAASIPNFVAIALELMEVALGSVGLLKALMLHALELQLNAPSEAWSAGYLKKAAKSVKLLKKIREETETGEAMLEGATFGESAFADTAYLARLSEKMGGPIAA